jgi:tetratricopeptide (TPR) repeat protein
MKDLIVGLLATGILASTGCSGSIKAPPAQAPAAPAVASPQAMVHAPHTLSDWAKGAQLFDGLGTVHRQVSTKSPEAQKYFDQGMRLLWAFNHDEATRSFAKAAELDPQCAICDWGVALTVGPNYNLPVVAESRASLAFEELNVAQRKAAQASPVEQALIAALAKRYPSAQPLNPSNSVPVLTAYAAAMKEVARKFPADLDVQTFYAEALMNIRAWNLWTPDGKPQPETEEILATLESVMKRDPRHPGANHYYIHATESSPHPERALAAAERLKDMMPAAGHLVHMPAHTFQRVGRYEEAAEANRKGAAADEAYFAKTAAPDYYSMYTAHNYQFLAAATAMEGRKAETLDAVARMRKSFSDEMALSMPGYDWPLSEEYSATVRFGLWDQMLAKPAPNPKMTALMGGYLYARGFALAAKGRRDEAAAALSRLEQMSTALPADALAGFNPTKDIFAVAIDVLKARIADEDQRPDDAIALLKDAVAREDKLTYNEPRDWFFPVRHVLGAVLLKADRPADAEAVYREDLKRNPENGWSLIGLREALKAQQKSAEAASVDKRLSLAWIHADVMPRSSAY